MNRAVVKAASKPIVSAVLTWIAPATVLALVCWGTLAPQDPMPKYFGGQDKLEHLVAFMLLSATMSAAAPGRFIVFVAGFCLSLSFAVEFGQAVFTLHREPSLRDAAASIIGSCIGIGGITILRLFVASRGGLRAFLQL